MSPYWLGYAATISLIFPVVSGIIRRSSLRKEQKFFLGYCSIMVCTNVIELVLAKKHINNLFILKGEFVYI